MIRPIKALFAQQTQTWDDCPDWGQAIILDKIPGIIRAMMEKEQGVRQACCEGYTEDWAAVAAELQSQASSQTTRRPAQQSQTPGDFVMVAAELRSQPSSQAPQWPAHRVQTPSYRHIGTPVGQQDSQNDLQDTASGKCRSMVHGGPERSWSTKGGCDTRGPPGPIRSILIHTF